MSSASAAFGFLSSLLDFINGIFSDKRENKKNLWSEILDRRAQLALALEEGRITDVAAIRKELDSLMKQYSRRMKREERALRRSSRGGIRYSSFCLAVSATLFLASASLLSGCAHPGGGKEGNGGQTTLVVGERVRVVAPGSSLSVPELVPPARTWYLVDNVAIQQWLGITVDYREGASR